jgi:hypothetical protein
LFSLGAAMNRPGGKSVIITLRGGLPVDLTAIRRHLTGCFLISFCSI